MTFSLLRPSRRAALRRTSLVLCVAAVALTAGALSASSASALQWWVGTPTEFHELEPGEKLTLNPTAKVEKPFTFKWLKKYEVKCSGAKYNGLYLEGTASLGAKVITFEGCAAKKPKHATLVGGKIETSELHGKLEGAAPNVEFNLKPVSGPVAEFEIERTVKPKHHLKHGHTRQCTYKVTATGELSGDLGNPEPITTEKTFEFDSTKLLLTQKKNCEEALSDRKPSRPAARPLGREATALVMKTAKGGRLATDAELLEVGSNLTFTASGVTVTCEESVLAGELLANRRPELPGDVLSAESNGSFIEPGACKGVQQSPAVEFPAFITWQGLPWEQGFAEKSYAAKGAIGVKIAVVGGPECSYETTAIGGRPLHPKGLLTLGILGHFTLVHGEPSCAGSVTLEGELSAFSGGENVELGVAESSEKEELQEEEELKEEQGEEAEEAEENPVEANKGRIAYAGTLGWGVR